MKLRSRFVRGFRNFALICTIAMVVLSGVIFSLPIWMGFAMRLLLPEEQVSFDNYSMEGYRRFELKNLHIDVGPVEIRISDVNAYSPLVWLWQVSQRVVAEPLIQIGDCCLSVKNNQESEVAVAEAEVEMAHWYRKAGEIREQLQRWVPWGTVETLSFDRGDFHLIFENLRWKDGEIFVQIPEASLPAFEHPVFHIQLALPGEERHLTLCISLPDHVELLNLNFEQIEPSRVLGTFYGVFEGNRCTGSMEWVGPGWIPDHAEMDLRAMDLNLKDWYADAPASCVNGDFHANWANQVYRVKGAFSTPADDATMAEYLKAATVQFEAEGDLKGIRINQVFVETALGTLSSKTPLVFDYSSKQLSGIAEGVVALDLGGFGVRELSGPLNGRIEVAPRESDLMPLLTFEIFGERVAYRDLVAQTLSLIGSADFERLEVTSFRINAKEHSSLEGSLVYEIPEKKLSALQLVGDLDPSMLTGYLGDALSAERVRIDGFVQGTLMPLAVQYRAHVEVDSLKTNGLHPLQVTTDLHGGLEGLTMDLLQLKNPFDSQLLASGDLSWGNGISGMIRRLRLEPTSGNAAVWDLKDTVFFSFNSKGLTQTGPTILIEPATLESAVGHLTASLKVSDDGAKEGALLIEQVDVAEFVQPWVEQMVPDIYAKHVSLRFGALGKPIEIAGSLDAVLTFEDNAIQTTGELLWDGTGLHLNHVALTAGETPWLTIDGTLPYQFEWVDGELLLVVTEDDSLSLSMFSSHSEEWIPLLQSYVSIPLKSADIRAQMAGSLAHPVGSIQAMFVTVPQGDEHGIPSAQLHGEIRIEGTHVQLMPLTLKIAEARFELEGDVELPVSLLSQARLEATPILWDELSYRLRASETDLAPLAYFFPEVLRPAGNLLFDLSGSWGGGIKGELHLEGISTKAVFPFGALRDLNGDLVFEDRRVELTHFSGGIGREPVEMSGWAVFDDMRNPIFEFHLKGEDIPIVRRAGMLLRTDMDLHASQKQGETAVVEGSLLLKDGVLLMDVTELFDSSAGGRGVQSRPPYFAVEVEPFRDWKLQLSVKGDAFLKLKTPVVDGLVSMAMNLEGTMGEPFMHGRLWFDEGSIRFPFASFGINRGSVLLSRENPFTPVLDIRGESSRLDYQLQLDIRGDAFAPEVHFTASPSLSSDQIILMIVAGDDPTGTLEFSNTQKASKIGSYLSQGLLGSGDGTRSSLLSRLTLEWGNKLSQEGKETLDLEYVLNNEFQLIGEYDVYDNWNAGIRWRVIDPAEQQLKVVPSVGLNAAREGADDE